MKLYNLSYKKEPYIYYIYKRNIYINNTNNNYAQF